MANTVVEISAILGRSTATAPKSRRLRVVIIVFCWKLHRLSKTYIRGLTQGICVCGELTLCPLLNLLVPQLFRSGLASSFIQFIFMWISSCSNRSWFRAIGAVHVVKIRKQRTRAIGLSSVKVFCRLPVYWSISVHRLICLAYRACSVDTLPTYECQVLFSGIR